MYYIGVDLGGTNIAVGVTNEEGKILHKDSVPTKSGRHYAEIIKDMAELSIRVVKDAGLSMEDVKAVGIGAPGTPDPKNGILMYANNLGFRDVPMRAEFQKTLNKPVFIENDANCAALAEVVAGAAKGAEVSLTITLGTGVGSGVAINGHVFSGFNGMAAEMGHMVIKSGGEPCTCGRQGCWEVYASATALIRQTREAAEANPESMIWKLVDGDLNKVNAKVPFDAAKAGDAVADAVIRQYIQYLADGLANAINIFGPDVVVIGGGVCAQGDYLLKPLHALVEQEVYGFDTLPCDIRVAQMGNDAGIVGAAMLGRG